MTEQKRFLITPPPGLLPEAPGAPPEPEPERRVDEEHGDSATRRVMPRSPGVAFPLPANPMGGLAPAVAGPAPAAESAPGSAPAPSSVSTPSGEAEVPTGEHPAQPGPWTIRLPDGATQVVTTSGVVLGRNPVVPERWPAAERLRIHDPERTVSSTHALLIVVGGALRLIDLGSTNGVAVTSGGLREKVAGVDGVKVGDPAEIELGSFHLRVARA
ncbi:FHA domain-containing protein [Schumannella soli]|uniref:FHA domain-containing protein n=1 Tax=Schumannella soli TaxID=2590779 RepID=A0A506Y0L4_9MICO|nr:FHA domain-containing protein [Schumannella soli]TPW75027.1 FHA domain-containing protein [Schumannella soli]